MNDIEELPAELVRQLSKTMQGAGLTGKALKLFANDTVMDIDQFLIAYYREYKVVLKRTKAVAILYRLHNAGHIKRIKGKKGWYEGKA